MIEEQEDRRNFARTLKHEFNFSHFFMMVQNLVER